MKSRYVVVRDPTSKAVDETRNVIYDVEGKHVIYRKKTKNKEDRYWHSRAAALAEIGELMAGVAEPIYNAKYDFYHLS